MTYGHTTRIILISIVAAVMVFAGVEIIRASTTVTEAGADLAPGAEPRFSFQAITAPQAEAISWALTLFERADLDLPRIEFVGHDDRDGCHGRDGAARRTDGGARISLCAQEIGPVQEWVILHEIAHAWDYHNLDDERRAAFLELRGLDSWREGVWHERGAENAAEIMVWGLIDRPVKPGHIYDTSCEDLLAGYLVLVGDQPLHGYTEACE